MSKANEELFKKVLKSAENGALENVAYWIQTYNTGLCSLPTAIEEILISLGIIEEEEESTPVKDYEDKANDFIKDQISDLLE